MIITLIPLFIALFVYLLILSVWFFGLTETKHLRFLQKYTGRPGEPTIYNSIILYTIDMWIKIRSCRKGLLWWRFYVWLLLLTPTYTCIVFGITHTLPIYFIITLILFYTKYIRGDWVEFRIPRTVAFHKKLSYLNLFELREVLVLAEESFYVEIDDTPTAALLALVERVHTYPLHLSYSILYRILYVWRETKKIQSTKKYIGALVLIVYILFITLLFRHLIWSLGIPLLALIWAWRDAYLLELRASRTDTKGNRRPWNARAEIANVSTRFCAKYIASVFTKRIYKTEESIWNFNPGPDPPHNRRFSGRVR